MHRLNQLHHVMNLKLQKYVTIVKESLLYAIAMVLDLVRKLNNISMTHHSNFLVDLLMLLNVDEERGVFDRYYVTYKPITLPCK